MEEKEDKKKGFFASLFAPKPCKCSCGVQIEEVEEDGNPSENLKKAKPKYQKRMIRVKIKVTLADAVAKIIHQYSVWKETNLIQFFNWLSNVGSMLTYFLHLFIVY